MEDAGGRIRTECDVAMRTTHGLQDIRRRRMVRTVLVLLTCRVFDHTGKAYVIEKTGDSNDKILVCILQPKPTITTAHEKLAKAYFLPTSEHFYPDDVRKKIVIMV